MHNSERHIAVERAAGAGYLHLARGCASLAGFAPLNLYRGPDSLLECAFAETAVVVKYMHRF